MPATLFNTSRPGALRAAMLLLIVAVLFGGASRIEIAGPIVVRVVAVCAIGWLLWARHGSGLKVGRGAFWFWLVLLALPLLQLIPIPWATWTMLPGRALPTAIFTTLGERPAMPLSLTPSRTLNAFLALLPPLAAYMLGARLDSAGRSILLRLGLLLAVGSAIIGVLQILSGPESGLYFYAITNSDSSVGLFANANHMALFMCAGVVLTFVWFAEELNKARAFPAVAAFLAAAALLILLGALAGTASRAGAILAVIAILGGILLLPAKRINVKRWQLTALAAVPLGVAATVLALMLNGYILAGRFRIEDGENARIGLLPVFTRIVRDYFPAGSGLGSFDPVFRTYEKADSLAFGYLNQAHNDYAQVAIEAGLVGMVIIVAFLLWYAVQIVRLWDSADEKSRVPNQRRASALIIALILAHSAVDYPLRTAAIATLFAFLIAFLTPPYESERAELRKREKARMVEDSPPAGLSN